jgi:hypothetical protein
MLHHPTLEKLQTLRLSGMYKALTEQMTMPDSETLSFEERLGLLVDREMTERDDNLLDTHRKPACAGPSSSTPPVSRISTTARCAGSTRPCSCSWPPAAGYTRV